MKTYFKTFEKKWFDKRFVLDTVAKTNLKGAENENRIIFYISRMAVKGVNSFTAKVALMHPFKENSAVQVQDYTIFCFI